MGENGPLSSKADTPVVGDSEAELMRSDLIRHTEKPRPTMACPYCRCAQRVVIMHPSFDARFEAGTCGCGAKVTRRVK